MIDAVLFDLDDTLYPEEQYVRSGFAAVGERLAALGHGDARENAEVFAAIHFGEGRDGVFDAALARLGFPAGLVPDLVRTHREHRPRGLALYDDADAVLTALRGRYRLGVVTDGWASVQQGKVAALGLESRVDCVFLTDSLGRERWKPHPEPFQRCLAALGVQNPARAVFVGDNPARDIDGARNAGLLPVRIARAGAYFGSAAEATPRAPTLVSLQALPALLHTLGNSA